jgi:ankyrin repeat protein
MRAAIPSPSAPPTPRCWTRCSSPGLSPDVRRTDRFTLLHAAAEADQGDAIRVLLAHGAAIDLTVEPPVVRRAAREPVSERWIIGRTPLWIALAGHHAHALTALLAQGATATVRLSDGTTTLHLAARWTGPLTPDDAADAPGSRPRDVSGLIRLLVAEGADPNALTLTSAEPGAPVHRTPLHEACAVHAFEAAETLLSLGADGHCADSLGCEPWRLALTDAARRGSWVDLFARHGIAIATTDLHRLALQDAVEQGDHEQVERLVADEPSLAALAPPAGSRADQAPLLQVAIGRHDPALVAILLEHGADALARDGRGRPSLHRAIETNQPELLTLLLAHGAQLDDLSRCDAASAVTPLAIALGRNPGGQPLRDPVQPLALVRALLDAGADANAPIGPDHSALEIACASGQIAAAKLLIAHGAHCAFCDSAGRTLLHLLAWGSPAGMELAELLLAAGLDVNQAETVRRETPLHRLARSARTPAIRLLVAHGAHVDARDVRQRTPLAFAAESGNVSGLEALLEAGAAVDAVDADGQTPLTIAIEAAQVDIRRAPARPSRRPARQTELSRRYADGVI